jgi:hypothetical protein
VLHRELTASDLDDAVLLDLLRMEDPLGVLSVFVEMPADGADRRAEIEIKNKLAHLEHRAGERIVGLSKLARVVERFARDLRIQERLTVQIADWLQTELQPAGVGVVLEAEHLCMTLRGVQQPGARTVTSALRGAIRDDHQTRQEFLALTARTSQ